MQVASDQLDKQQNNNAKDTLEPAESKQQAKKLVESIVKEPSARHLYLEARTLNYQHLPRWLKNRCYNIANNHYSSVSHLIFDTAIKLVTDSIAANKLIAPVIRHQTNMSPERVVGQILAVSEKKRGSHAAKTKFDHKKFADLDLDSIEDLKQLQEACDPRRRAPKKIPALLNSRSSKSGLVEALKEAERFDPKIRSSTGDAALAAYREISSILIGYTFVADLAQAYDIPLKPRQISTLISSLGDQPLEVLSQEPTLHNLIEYADKLETLETELQYLAREEVFDRFALNGLNFDAVLEYENNQLQEAQRLTNALQNQISTEPAVSREELAREALHEILDPYAQDSTDAEMVRSLVNFCLKRSIEPGLLKTVLVSNNGNFDSALSELRSKDQRKRTGPSQPEVNTDSSMKPEFFDPVTPEIVSYEIFVHPNQGKKSVASWLGRLASDHRQQLLHKIEKVAAGQRGMAKSLANRTRNEIDVSVFEIKTYTGPGYRVYFRYLPGRKIVLLNAGDKDSQDHDIDIAFKLANEYTGIKEGDKVELEDFVV